MADEKKPAKSGGDFEAAYQIAMGAIEDAYQKTIKKETKKETKKDSKEK